MRFSALKLWSVLLVALDAARAAAGAGATPDTTSMHHHHGMDMAGMSHAAHVHPGGHAHDLAAFYGPYPLTREASGTSWQPEAAPHRGLHGMRGAWSTMVHGNADAVFDRQGGPRGARDVFGSNMLMLLATRPLGPGRLGLRSMSSLEPLTIGRRGYPLLLQTGESADGRDPLLDRQHPHDLFMELAASYAVSDATRSLFLYAGLPGEPALGPPAYMHRFAGEAVPETPITHHWLDSTHITYGVVTLGAIRGGIKLEASAFRGREPDHRRWNLESPKLDSYALRASVNPSPAWAIQLSGGRLESPEALEPDVDQRRLTASVATQRGVGPWAWGALLAVGRLRNRPGHVLDALLLESALERGRGAVFARAAWVKKDELFPEGDPLTGRIFGVGRVGAGASFEVFSRDHLAGSLGAYGAAALVPGSLAATYGSTPLSVMAFARLRLR